MSERDGVVVRRIRAEEGMRLREIRLRALADSPRAFGSTLAVTATRPETVWTERAASNAAAEESVMFVAETGNEWVGLGGGLVEPERPDEPEVISMWVDPAWRRGGVGARLLANAVLWCESRKGARNVRLWVTEANEPAIGLYQRSGFAFTGEWQPLPSDPALRELEMARPIRS